MTKSNYKKIELVSPAGNLDKLRVAFCFGADAVYLAGKRWGLRAQADNFERDEIVEAVRLAKTCKKNVYITLNILARGEDFDGLDDYIAFLNEAKVNGVIASDLGVMARVKAIAPTMPIHVSTQANVSNAAAALEYVRLGASRIVLARELNLSEIAVIRKALPKSVRLEAFVHGAMCMGISGRCLISNYLAGRDSNRGDCSQPCRWEFGDKSRHCEEQSDPFGKLRAGSAIPCKKLKSNIDLTYPSSRGNPSGELEVQEDNRGTYFFNSNDLNMIEYIDKLYEAGVDCFKIEGRVKSVYYVAAVTGAYRKMIDLYAQKGKEFVPCPQITSETYKVAHRGYSTGFYLGGDAGQNYVSSQAACEYDFVGAVIEDKCKDGYAVIEQRNRFVVGDTLEVMSPAQHHNAQLIIAHMTDLKDNPIPDAKFVQQKLKVYTDIPLKAGDMLRKNRVNHLS
ncbi:MAG: U32 family peptidase [Firmicutes bacterium]|nr:U32 family peptidase [Bacillota bacterium]